MNRDSRATTPIEQHIVNRRVVYVKRDDLFAAPPSPPLGKLRGLNALLQKYHVDEVKLVGCWDTRVSKLGQGLAVAVRKYKGMRAIVSYPCLKNGNTPVSVSNAAKLGAEILPLRGNHVSICYSQARKVIECGRRCERRMIWPV